MTMRPEETKQIERRRGHWKDGKLQYPLILLSSACLLMGENELCGSQYPVIAPSGPRSELQS